MTKRLVAWKVTCFREINMYRLHQLDRTQLTGLFHCLIWLAFLFIQNISLLLIGFNINFRNLLMLTKFGKSVTPTSRNGVPCCTTFLKGRGRRWPYCFPPTFLDPLCLPVWRHIVTGKSLGSLVQISKGYHSY